MKLFLTISKKGLIIALCAIAVLFLTAMWSSSLKLSAIDGSTHAKRMIFIKQLGVSVNEENCTSKVTVIPDEFSDVYLNYNNIQKSAGFDLSSFKGKEVTIYSYSLVGEEKILTLIVCENNIIGGDIAETSLGGKMQPLK